MVMIGSTQASRTYVLSHTTNINGMCSKAYWLGKVYSTIRRQQVYIFCNFDLEDDHDLYTKIFRVDKVYSACRFNLILVV